MAHPQFSIGIDLGTTNCAMAFEGLGTAARQRELFLIPQWETATRFSEASTLPSFLYLLSEDEAAQMSRQQHAARGMDSRPPRENTGGRIAGTRRPLRKIVAMPSWSGSQRIVLALEIG